MSERGTIVWLIDLLVSVRLRGSKDALALCGCWSSSETIGCGVVLVGGVVDLSGGDLGNPGGDWCPSSRVLPIKGLVDDGVGKGK